MPHRWTAEQIAFIEEAYRSHSRREVHAMVNDRFGLAVRLSQVVAAIKNRRMQSGRTGHFSGPGWNAGTKGLMKPNSGSFQPGRAASEARNYLPIGSTRITKDGYLERKITDDPSLVPARRWEFEHRLIWKEAHGEIPAGHVIVFLDGNPSNLELENLRCVSRGVLPMMNKRGLSKRKGEFRKAAILSCELELRAKQRHQEAA